MPRRAAAFLVVMMLPVRALALDFSGARGHAIKTQRSGTESRRHAGGGGGEADRYPVAGRRRPTARPYASR